MVKIKWTLFTLQDIDDIASFIAKDSPHYNRIVYKLFQHHLEILTVHHSARLLSDSSLFDK